MKLSRKRTIIGIILLLVAAIGLVLSIAFAKLNTREDGTKNYTGVKLEAAQRALDWDVDLRSPNVFMPITRGYVDKVEPTTSEEMNGPGLHCDASPDEPAYYSVTIRRVLLFGITMETITYKVCNITG